MFLNGAQERAGAHVGYEMIGSLRGATHQVGYNDHLISNKHELKKVVS